MGEIDGPGFGVNKVNFAGVQKPLQEELKEADNTDENNPKITDFSNPSAEAIGRSMLVKSDDNTNNDLKVLINNPQIAENSNKIFETAYKAAQLAGAENPYEEASAVSTTAI